MLSLALVSKRREFSLRMHSESLKECKYHYQPIIRRRERRMKKTFSVDKTVHYNTQAVNKDCKQIKGLEGAGCLVDAFSK